MSRINKIKYNLKTKIWEFMYLNELAEDSCVSDTYLVEYPKSGVTWLSTLVANYSLILSEKGDKVTFFNVSQFIPDIHTAKRLGEKLYTKPSTRFIKSHAQWNPYYVHTVYLVRHPYNVMKSYYKFLWQNNNQAPSFDEFIRDKTHGIPAWKQHVQSWLVSSGQVNHVHVIKYEDLRRDTFETMSILFNNLGIELCQESLNIAIEKSSLESMKKYEGLYKKNNPRYQIDFVGEGGVGYSNDDKEYIEQISELAKNELQLLAY